MTSPGQLSSRFIVGIRVGPTGVNLTKDRLILLKVEVGEDDGTITPDVYLDALGRNVIQVTENPTLSADGPPAVGTTFTATPPTYIPADASISGQWWRSDNTEIDGETSATYEATEDDEGIQLFKRFTLSKTGFNTLVIDTPLSGVIQAASPGPVIADQAFDVGALTLAGAGGWLPTNTGGAITFASIDSGNTGGIFQISPEGLITTVGAGTAASRTLVCTFGNADGSDTATITATALPNTYSVRTEAELTVIAGLNSPINLNGKSVRARGPLHGGQQMQWPYGASTGWFSNKNYTLATTFTSHDASDPGEILIGPRTAAAVNCQLRSPKNLTFTGLKFLAPFIKGVNTPAQAAGSALIIIGAVDNFTITENDFNGWWKELVDEWDFTGLFVNGLTAKDYSWKGIIGFNSVTIGSGGFTCTDNTIHGSSRLLNFIAAAGSGPMTITGNELYDFAGDAILMAQDFSNCRVQWNIIHSPLNLQSDPYHPDAIQGVPGMNVSGGIIGPNFIIGARSDAYATYPGIRRDPQVIFLEDIGAGKNYSNFWVILNFGQTSSPHGVSAYNFLNGVIAGNTMVVNPSWSENPSLRPRIRALQHTTGGTGSGNVLRDNAAIGVSIQAPITGTLINNTAPDVLLPASYATFFTGPNFNAPDTPEEIDAAFENKVGGPLDTPLTKIGSGAGYVDFDSRIWDYPSLNTTPAWTLASKTGVTPNSYIPFDPISVASVLRSDGAASTEGALVWWENVGETGYGAQVQIEAADGSIITPRIGVESLLSAGQRFRLWLLSPASGRTTTYSVWCGGVKRSISVTSA